MQNEYLEKKSLLVNTMTFKSLAICILWKVFLNNTKNWNFIFCVYAKDVFMNYFIHIDWSKYF